LAEGVIEPDYVVWMQKAMSDALRLGVPREYVERCLRPLVGDEKEESLQEIMMVRTMPPTTWRGGIAAGTQGRVMGGLDRG